MSSAARAGRVAFAVGTLVALAARPALAAGPTQKAVCLAAYEDAQRLRVAGKLVGAREQLRVCRADVCPALVRNECEKWLEEVAASLPSVVLSARDPSGKDLLDVTASIDGARVPALDGKALDVDPGSHIFRFERGKEVKEERWLVRQGEHNRVIVGVLGEPGAARGPGAAAAKEPGPQRALGLVLGGAGVVGLGVAAAVGLASNGDASTLRETCGVDRSCTQDQVDAVVGTRTVAGVVAALGGAALVTGVVLFLTAPAPERAASSASAGGARASWRAWTWGAAPVPGGLVGAASASF